jgi:Tfp pilus assembly protein PilN
MKRLEHIRTLRNQASRFQGKTPHGAVMALAQIIQEKQRLELERGGWERRVQKIEKRLKEIAGMEEKLSTLARLARPPGSSRSSEEGTPADLVAGLPRGFKEVTMRY